MNPSKCPFNIRLLHPNEKLQIWANWPFRNVFFNLLILTKNIKAKMGHTPYAKTLLQIHILDSLLPNK